MFTTALLIVDPTTVTVLRSQVPHSSAWACSSASNPPLLISSLMDEVIPSTREEPPDPDSQLSSSHISRRVISDSTVSSPFDSVTLIIVTSINRWVCGSKEESIILNNVLSNTSNSSADNCNLL